MSYLPKYFPPFVKLLSAIAKRGNKYKGSDMTPLNQYDREKLDDIVEKIQVWVRENPGLLQKAGVRPENNHVVFFDFDKPKLAAK
jgi:hypothetical protein